MLVGPQVRRLAAWPMQPSPSLSVLFLQRRRDEAQGFGNAIDRSQHVRHSPRGRFASMELDSPSKIDDGIASLPEPSVSLNLRG